MAWIDEEHGWVAAPEDIMNALSSEGFEECKREMTTSRQDSRPAAGGRASTHVRDPWLNDLGESSDLAGRHRVHGDQWRVTHGRRRPETGIYTGRTGGEA
jgi:hypothetical protein